MNPAIAGDLARRLVADYGFKEAQGFLRQGVCPECKQKELYTKTEAPWIVRCGRLSKCGWQGRIKDLYPDVFANFNKRFKPTEANPHATADAYLMIARGLPLEPIRGWYEQGSFWHAKADRGTATVRFYVDADRRIYMERFCEPVAITDEDGRTVVRKAHFGGAHRGLWWTPPGQTIRADDTVWIVEGIIDAICLSLSGLKVAAVLSCVNYPSEALKSLPGGAPADRVDWVWALDNDHAGQEWTRKHVGRMRKAGLRVAAAQIPTERAQGREKIDWNDLYQRGALTNEDLVEYRYHGALLIAKTPTEKALLIYGETERQQFPFEFHDRLFFFDLDLKKYAKAVEDIQTQDKGGTDAEVREQALRSCGAIHEIANCYPEALYYQANAMTDEAWYYYRIRFPHGAAPVKNTFTGGQLASASEFKKRLLGIASGALYTGTSTHLDQLLRQQIHGLKVVETIDFVGYSSEHQAYIFNEVAVAAGKTFALNDEDYFDIGKRHVKSLGRSVGLHLNTDPLAYRGEWVEHLWEAFGTHGLVALAFWFGSLFAEQIRDKQSSFPFLEIIGEPASGKSTLIEFLWRLMGRRDYEGFDPSKSTLAARARNFAQVANLPIVLIEGDRGQEDGQKRGFEFDELKTAYNGRSVRSRGHKNSGNETYEPPFRGTIVISQNADVQASDAIEQRLVRLEFSRVTHTAETKRLADLLQQTPLEQVSGWALRCIAKEREVLEEFFAQQPQWEKAILARRDLRSVRIAKNHGQMIACLHAMAKVMKLPSGAAQETEDFIFDTLAPERQRAINADHPMVQEFWELVEYLGIDGLNHSKNGCLALNLNHVVGEAEKARQQVPPIADLKRLLRDSRTRKFIGLKGVSSRLWSETRPSGEHGDQSYTASKTVKCWCFGQGGEA